MATSLATLQTPLTQTQIFQILLAVYQAQGFPTSAWQTGGVERTRLMAFATALYSVSANYIPAFANGLLVDTSTSDGQGGGWLPLLAEQVYALPQNGAVSTEGTVTLTSAAGVFARTVGAGELIIVFGSTGNRYINVAPINIPAGPGSVNATFRAEFPGASYADANSQGDITLVTPIPGVTVSNVADPFTDVVHVGSGTGTVRPAGGPTQPHSVVITITSTGASGVATWAYSIDGAPAVSVGAVSSLSNIGMTNIDVVLQDGPDGISFVLGDTYQFSAPGSWITQQGADIESDVALRGRLKNRWTTLSWIPTTGYYELLARSVPGVGAQVTEAIVLVDPLINDQVNIVIAGPAGVLPSSVITAVQAFISPKSRGLDVPVVQSPSSMNITIAGNVTVTAAQRIAAAVQINAAMDNLIHAAGINGTIRIASIIDTIMSVPGVIDVSGVTINTFGNNLILGSPTSYVLGRRLALLFSYVSV